MDTSPEKDFFDLENLDESVEVEFKAAQGRDGRGELPKSFWESYVVLGRKTINPLQLKDSKPARGGESFHHEGLSQLPSQ